MEGEFNRGEAKRSVLTVGQGRGFVVKSAEHLLVIMAAHCLPHLPFADPAAEAEQRTYRKLLGLLGDEPTLTTECLFVDPVSGLAVLGPPPESLPDEGDAYKRVVGSAMTFSIAPMEGDSSRGWLLSLAGNWFSCNMSHYDGGLWVTEASQGIIGGMPGSPILADDGAVIGVVSCSSGSNGDIHTAGGPNPCLAHHLPVWLWRDLSAGLGD